MNRTVANGLARMMFITFSAMHATVSSVVVLLDRMAELCTSEYCWRSGAGSAERRLTFMPRRAIVASISEDGRGRDVAMGRGQDAEIPSPMDR